MKNVARIYLPEQTCLIETVYFCLEIIKEFSTRNGNDLYNIYFLSDIR